jgi:hypothetical protein
MIAAKFYSILGLLCLAVGQYAFFTHRDTYIPLSVQAIFWVLIAILQAIIAIGEKK